LPQIGKAPICGNLGNTAQLRLRVSAAFLPNYAVLPWYQIQLWLLHYTENILLDQLTFLCQNRSI